MADDPKPVPMFDATGTLRDVPYDRMVEVLRNGFRPAVSMTFPSGKSRYVPAAQMTEASQHGATVNPYEDQPTNHPTWYHHALSDVWGAVKGMAETVLDPSGTVTGQDPAGDLANQMRSEKQVGYSLPYRAVAPLIPGSGAMEQSAREGDPTGVVTHAATNAAMVATPLMAEHPMIQALAEKMTPSQLHSVIEDYVNPKYDAPGTVRHGKPMPGGGWGQLWNDESGEAGLPPKKPSQKVGEVGDVKKPPQSSGGDHEVARKILSSWTQSDSGVQMGDPKEIANLIDREGTPHQDIHMGRAVFDKDEFKDSKPGDVISFEPHSFSKDSGYAKNFAIDKREQYLDDGLEGNPEAAVIHVVKPVKALDVSKSIQKHFSPEEHQSYQDVLRHEQEVVTHGDFKVISHTVDDEGVHHVNVEPATKQSSGGNPTRDTEVLNQIKKDHPDWTMSQQLQEAAKRVNPKATNLSPQKTIDQREGD